MEGATKYLVPSTLGIGLVEGYNQIGLVKNVSKPQMRREVCYLLMVEFLFSDFYITTSRCSQTERRMVQVCEGTVTKNDMIMQGLEQYKEMFTIVRRDFQRVTSVSTCPLP